MTGWPRRLIAVPTSALRIDHGIAPQSPKGYTDRELKEIAATVPAIYDCISHGWSEPDFTVAARSGDRNLRQLGVTFERLFADPPNEHRLEASFDGRDLVVDRGNHRVLAARRIEVPVLPVWVRTPTPQEGARVEADCARVIEDHGAGYYLDAHRSLDSERHQAQVRGPDQIPGHRDVERCRNGREFLH